MSSRPRPIRAAFALLCLCLASAAWASPKAADPFADAHTKKAVVLLFIARDCPISNTYAPEIKRIIAQYTPQKIAFTLVYPDPETTLAAAKKHAQDYGYSCPILVDPKHRLSQKFGMIITPEVAVLAPNGKLLYRGRIDDLYITFGQRRYAVTTHDLRNALEAVLKNRPIPTPRTTAVGCFI